jgi:uncharacterized membrane protein
MPHILTQGAFALHIGGGLVGLLAGTLAICVRKGGRWHRAAGNVFFAAMVVMAVFAIYLAVVLPNQVVNIFIGMFALYLVGTAWLTVRRRPGAAGLAEKIALGVGVLLCAPFVTLSVQLLLGLPPAFQTPIPFKGPLLIAIYSFTGVLLTGAIGDARVVFAGGIAGAPRIARHLWRMCLGLALAAGSGFTNGFARLLPGPYHVPMVFFLPQLVPVVLLVFWMVRVRGTSWFGRNARSWAV